MPAMLLKLLASLRALGVFLVAIFGNMNITGWVVAASVPIAFLAIWSVVLHYVGGFLGSYMSAALASGQIFGVSLPSGALFLLNAMWPMQLFFTLTVDLLTFRAGSQVLLAVAVAATRFLKAK